MILTLMRHPSVDPGGQRCIGQTDVDLSPEGRAALMPLAQEACRLRPDRILCSDLQRCQLLAKAIAAQLGLVAEPDVIWREVSFGRWENRTWSDIRAGEPQALSEWIADFDTSAPPGGESFAHLQARVLKGIEKINTVERPVSHCLVVTHAGVIRAAVCAFSGLPLRKAFELAVPYGSQISFCRSGNRWSPVDPLAGRRSFSPGRAL